MDESRREELGALLRANRDQLQPRDVGLDATARRRSPGLRREEVATLAGVSVAWYTWLEQGRVSASRQVIEAVCRALRMDDEARAHALALGGFWHADQPATARRSSPTSETRTLVDHWRTTPALILDQRLDILGANPAWVRLWGELGDLPTARHNLLLWAADPARTGDRIRDETALLRGLYAHLRMKLDHTSEDPRATEILELLHHTRADLADRWNCRTVASFRPTTIEVDLARPDGAPVSAPSSSAIADPGRGTDRLHLTCSLLGPVAEPDTVLFVQAPADARSGALLGRVLGQ